MASLQFSGAGGIRTPGVSYVPDFMLLYVTIAKQTLASDFMFIPKKA